jgi:hypothetical protein
MIGERQQQLPSKGSAEFESAKYQQKKRQSVL